MDKTDNVFEFPCKMDFKIIAVRKQDIEATILNIVKSQGISIENLNVAIRPSKKQ